ncbi:MAG TPA: two-component regulator propeller domain-containing protein [Gammaproteobacteria bacterium]
MNISYKGGAVIALAVAGLLAGAYTLGTKQSGKSAVPLASASDNTSPAVPPSHPPVGGEAKAGADPNAKFTHFRVGNRNVKSILADGELMWVGTSGGVIRYDTTNDGYELYDNTKGLLSNGVFYVGKVGQRIAVGTYGGGLSLFDPASKQWQNYNVPQGLGDAFVYDMIETPNGDLWIATWSGANRVRGGKLDDRKAWETFTVENTKGGLPNDWVYGLENGKDGEVWLGTEGGLARFKDGKWQNWKHSDGLGADYELVKADIKFANDPGKQSSHHSRQKSEQGLDNVNVAYNPNYIISMAVDADGIVWCGTWGGGLARFDGKQWRNFTTKEGLPSNHIFMLHTDAQGELWFGTSDGLVHWDRQGNQVARTYTTADGLFSNNVFSMAEDGKQNRWIGSYGGVSRIVALAQ